MEQSTMQLDKLQNEVNLVLTHIGRVFGAVNRNTNKKPIAQVTKLKQVLPDANDRFQDALSELSYEIHLAQAIMRRDLVVCREKAGLHEKPAEVSQDIRIHISTQEEPSNDVDANATAVNESIPTSTVDKIEDIDMQDAPADQSSLAEKSLDQSATASTKEDAISAQDNGTKVEESQATQEDDKPIDALHVDIQAEATPDEDKAPETATTNNNDIDSLFGGPMSATADAVEFDFDQPTGDGTADAAEDFNFDTFAAGFDNATEAENDNISSLLPGLEQYANTEANTADVDFSSFFDNNTSTEATNPADQQQPTNAGDDIFGDFMNTTNFDGTTTGDGQPGDDGELDFDALFN